MIRPKERPIDRLRWKFWARSLRIQMSQSPDPAIADAAKTWGSVGRFLIGELNEDGKVLQDQRFRGVYRKGNDPRRLMQRVPVEGIESDLDPAYELVARTRSGHAVPNEPRTRIVYQEIPLDLVERADTLCPGSKMWEIAPLWVLTNPMLPELLALRSCMADLKVYLGLCNPSLAMLRPLIKEQDYEIIARRTLLQQQDEYSQSLTRVSDQPSAAATSLLGALILESFLTDNDLMEIHQDHFARNVALLLSHELMRDVAKDFMEMVANPFLRAEWEIPASYHVSSIREPYMGVDEMQALLDVSFPSLSVIRLEDEDTTNLDTAKKGSAGK